MEKFAAVTNSSITVERAKFALADGVVKTPDMFICLALSELQDSVINLSLSYHVKHGTFWVLGGFGGTDEAMFEEIGDAVNYYNGLLEMDRT